MTQKIEVAHPKIVRHPFTLVLLGGLALHGTLTAESVVKCAERVGLDVAAAARSVLMLMDEGLLSVARDGATGCISATPALADLYRPRRIRAKVAYLVTSKGLANA
ncbi:hypothetical protein [Falsiruegeria litorea]|uniref:hypothetical protein n=1 Tax=Falsiruegeria litorea TaxID=1280831 RepID=UPI001BFE0703|nr:hypothetical protein [Falsiruegeria litorea]MBT8169894.1 hypothetical protein [Falsiruegeria litorea]